MFTTHKQCGGLQGALSLPLSLSGVISTFFITRVYTHLITASYYVGGAHTDVFC